jgi:hypothetical protein
MAIKAGTGAWYNNPGGAAQAIGQMFPGGPPGTISGGERVTGGPIPAPSSYQQQINDLTGTDRNAFDALSALFKSYGLDTLAPKILQYVQQGFGADTITTLLQQTPEYQKRFAANQIRIKNGLPALSPAEYIATERAYAQVIQASGLPKGFYDSTSAYTDLIAKDISASEFQNRVNLAYQQAVNAPQGVKDALKQYYGLDESHIAAHYLDADTAFNVLQQQATSAQIGAAGQQSGLGLTNQSVAEEAARRGVNYSQAANALQNIAPEANTLNMLGSIYGRNYSNTTAEQEALLGDANAVNARRALEQQEQATFSGSRGGSNGGLEQARI